MPDISLQNFETDLVKASMERPVLLDIWAPWCGPCKALGPALEKLEIAYEGRFTLAKLNSDAQPEIAAQLSEMFSVRSIPFCVLFKGGQPVDGFVGALPEAQVRAFLDKHLPPNAAGSATEQVLAAVDSLIAEGNVDAALDMLRQAIAADPDDDTARYDLLRTLLGTGRCVEARAVYEPAASKIRQDARLAACGHWLAACEKALISRSDEQLDAALATDKRDFDARFERAQHRFATQAFTGAMDELLEILMRDKNWRDGLARQTYVAILTLMTPVKPATNSNPIEPTGSLELTNLVKLSASESLIDGYRRKLSMVVF